MNRIKKTFPLLLALAMLASSLVATGTASASSLPTSIVNGNFEYPKVSDSQWYAYEQTWGNWEDNKNKQFTTVNVPTGKIGRGGQMSTTGQSITGWSSATFGWQSTQKASGSVEAGNVELNRDTSNGNQFAELCADVEGTAIYQDVSVTPGEIMKWQLNHTSSTSRYTDKMQVMIGAPGKETVQTATRTASQNGNTVGASMTTIATPTTSDRADRKKWDTYTGTYTVPTGVTVVRFTFKNVASASTISGNDLDDISFREAYTVTYNKNASDATGTMSQQTFNAGDSVTLTANTFARTRYRFTGWKTQPSGGTTYADKAKITPTGNLTLYAQWEANKYTVRYHANPSAYMMGQGSMADQKFTFDQAQNLTANAFKSVGWTFIGWNTKADGSGKAFTDKQPVKNLTDADNGVVDLYAQWEANPTSISFEPNGGTGTTPPVNGLVGDDCKLTLNGYTRDGYTFKGWNTSTDGTGTMYADGATLICPVNPMTIHAQWTANASKLTYNANGGAGTMSDTEGVTDQQVTVSDNKYERDGYEFTGWNTKPDGMGDTVAAGSEYTLKSTPTVVYAQWKALPSSITYQANREDATGSTPDTTGVTDQQVTVNENGYKATGWSFTGWNTKPDGTGDSITPNSEFTLEPQPTTLYAQWTPDPASVRYDPNGGTGETPGYDGHTGDTPNASDNKFTPTNKCSTFTGWNTKQDGTGTTYKPDTQLPALLGELVLYAQWDDTSCPATVTYDANGGTGETPAYEGHLHDTPDTAANKFKGKDCDEFKGWNTEKDGSGTAYKEGDQLPELTGNITLYAQWERKTCPVVPLAQTGLAVNIIILTGVTLAANFIGATILILKHARKKRKT